MEAIAMRMFSPRLRLAIATIAILAGCKDYRPPVAPVEPPVLEPDFALVDANPNSPTSGRTCSPRQRLGAVSAWYFGHAT
jgi:hypothetical protein